MSPDKQSKRLGKKEKLKQQATRSRIWTLLLIAAGMTFLVFALIWPQLKSADEIKPGATSALSNADGLSLGEPNALVTIDVFEDFQCPACKYFTESIETLIIQNYVNTGKVRYNFHNYPFIDGAGAGNGGESDQAANASMCANEQGKFWDMHAILYANWNGENQGNLSDVRLKAMAQEIGLDTNAFNSCFDTNKYKAEIQADFDAGNTLGVRGTPSVFVNGVKVGQPGKIATYEEISQAVEQALK
jgi:protein-disulfide isomerase